MITTLILNFIYAALHFVLTPLLNLADVSINSGVTAAITTAGTYLGNVNQWLPVGPVLVCLGVLLTVEAGVLLYKLIMWGIRRIPGQG